MSYDELDALLDPDGALEAKFRELEAELDRAEAESELNGRARSRSDDPLADLKSQVGGGGKVAERVVLLLCPKCDTKNRASVARLRAELPRCGRCSADLAFERR